MPPRTISMDIICARSPSGSTSTCAPKPPRPHPLTEAGLGALLREQNWASPPFDTWALRERALTIVAGTFETTGMHGEVVLEVYATDGTQLANLCGPAPREVIAAGTPAVQRW